ncbi:DinB family protein [Sutcliffiella halmapala]|uniref:DinB family protein n=1 Tax=Sutcliffiella halmapala TaxID=79882 RepID=UPI0014754FE3|nr:DinB family protein [Sutcliffiella halmapala]
MYYEQTYEARKELLHLLETLNDELLHQKENPELWSVSENVEHLYLIETKIIKGLKAAIQTKLTVEAKDINLEKLLANRTYKVKAPEDLIPTSKRYTKDELIELLKQSRSNLEAFVKEVDDASLNQYGFNHRWIGDLSVQQWVQLIGYHERRHINQINETLRSTAQ